MKGLDLEYKEPITHETRRGLSWQHAQKKDLKVLVNSKFSSLSQQAAMTLRKS